MTIAKVIGIVGIFAAPFDQSQPPYTYRLLPRMMPAGGFRGSKSPGRSWPEYADVGQASGLHPYEQNQPSIESTVGSARNLPGYSTYGQHPLSGPSPPEPMGVYHSLQHHEIYTQPGRESDQIQSYSGSMNPTYESPSPYQVPDLHQFPVYAEPVGTSLLPPHLGGRPYQVDPGVAFDNAPPRPPDSHDSPYGYQSKDPDAKTENPSRVKGRVVKDNVRAKKQQWAIKRLVEICNYIRDNDPPYDGKILLEKRKALDVLRWRKIDPTTVVSDLELIKSKTISAAHTHKGTRKPSPPDHHYHPYHVNTEEFKEAFVYPPPRPPGSHELPFGYQIGDPVEAPNRPPSPPNLHDRPYHADTEGFKKEFVYPPPKPPGSHELPFGYQFKDPDANIERPSRVKGGLAKPRTPRHVGPFVLRRAIERFVKTCNYIRDHDPPYEKDLLHEKNTAAEMISLAQVDPLSVVGDYEAIKKKVYSAGNKYRRPGIAKKIPEKSSNSHRKRFFAVSNDTTQKSNNKEQRTINLAIQIDERSVSDELREAETAFVGFFNYVRNHDPPYTKQQTDRRTWAQGILHEAEVNLDDLVKDRPLLLIKAFSQKFQKQFHAMRTDDAGDPKVQEQRVMMAAAAAEVFISHSRRQSLGFSPGKYRNSSTHFESPSAAYHKMLSSSPLALSQSFLGSLTPLPYQQAPFAVDQARGPTLVDQEIDPGPLYTPQKDKGKDRTMRVRRPSLIRRGMSLATATTAQSSESAASTTDNVQDYVQAWKTVKRNATELIWPFITDMLVGTNSTIIIGAAWSIYAHLIPTQWSIVGPFFYGLVSLPRLNKNASVVHDTGLIDGTDLLIEDLYVNEIVINLYTKAWNGAYNALHKAGYLENLKTLSFAIGYHNQSLPFSDSEEAGIEQLFKQYHSLESANRSASGSDSNSSLSTRFHSLNTLLRRDYLILSSNAPLASSGVA